MPQGRPPFTLRGQAVNAGNAAVAGFAETGDLSWALRSPPHDAGDTLGARTPTQVTFPGDGSGFRTDSAVYREVGVVEQRLSDQGRFAADSGDPGNGDCVTGSRANTADGQGRYGCRTATPGPQVAGRFVPDRFRVTDSGFGFARACSSSFTYYGQPFPWSAAPQVTITALEQGGATTTNYEGPFWKLADYTDHYEDDSVNAEAADDGDDRALDPSGTSHGWPATANAKGQITVPYSGTLTYLRGNAPLAPIAGADQLVKLRFDVADADGVRYEAGANPPTYLITPITGAGPVRWGRLALGNAYGPQDRDLAVPFTAQYYDGSRFVTNSDDTCTGTAVDVRVSASDPDTGDDLALAESCIWDDAGESGGYACSASSPAGRGYAEPPVSGDFNLWLKAPGASTSGDTNAGSIDLAADSLPGWLKFDWDNDTGTAQTGPSGRATFGRYRGNDRILFWQEVYR